MADRYFIDDEPALIEKLDAFLGKLRQSLDKVAFAPEVVVLLLGGGYGRGEGGVYRGPELAGPALYNDLEFYVVTTGLRAPPGLEEWRHQWEKDGHEKIGIEVEFKILPASALREGKPSMFYYDLLLGHRVVWGDADFCATIPASLREPELIPAAEVTRLLFNRGSGLLFCREKLGENESPVDSAFIERNHAKARLALADSVLALNGRYDWSCQKRHRILDQELPLIPPDWETLKQWHEQGVQFKLHPRHEFPGVAELGERQAEVTQVWLRTFLWVESIRLKKHFSNGAAYAQSPVKLFPDSSSLKNIALRIRDQLRFKSRLPGLFDYPRAPLQKSLALLLGSLETDAATWRQASALLGLPATDNPVAIMQTYRKWWGRYN